MLVNDSDLLHAAARRHDAFTEEAVLQIAVHLETVEQAEALYLLSLSGAGERHEDGLLRDLHDLVRAALAHPELVGREAGNAVERRRAEAAALVADGPVRERIRAAPRAYVLAHTPTELARQATLCEPAPGRDDVRILVEQLDDALRVEIAARDRVGLLARSTRVLLEAGCSIDEATATTWGDHTALASYRVASAPIPDADAVRTALVASLKAPLHAAPVPEIELVFDDAGSPWHTRCTAIGPDRPGLLHALTSAFAAAGVGVHSARITTDGPLAVDHFELTEPDGAKLDERAKARIVEIAQLGAAPRKRRFARGDSYMTRANTKSKVGRPAWSD
jgi:[protein-PII] uridylyltransferase